MQFETWGSISAHTEVVGTDKENGLLKDIQDTKKQSIELKESIQNLLPATISGSLAHAFSIAKARYTHSIVDVTEEIGKPTIIIRLVFDLSIFLVPVASVVYINYFGNTTASITELLIKLFQSTPLILVSIYGLNSLLRKRKIYEMYNHKETFARSYSAVKRQLTDEHSKKRLDDSLLDVLEMQVETYDRKKIIENELYKKPSEEKKEENKQKEEDNSTEN